MAAEWSLSEQRKYKKDKNTYNVGKIKDEFTLRDAKIISIKKIDKPKE